MRKLTLVSAVLASGIWACAPFEDIKNAAGDLASTCLTEDDVRCKDDVIETCTDGNWVAGTDSCAAADACTTEGETQCASSNFEETCTNGKWAVGLTACGGGGGGPTGPGAGGGGGAATGGEFEACTAQGTCDDGLECNTATNSCVRRCTTSTDCLATTDYCELDFGGVCVPSSQDGEQCFSDAGCVGNLSCLALGAYIQNNATVPFSLCGQDCSVDACAAGTACASGQPQIELLAAADNSLSVQTCTLGGAECQVDGFTCQDAGGGQLACLGPDGAPQCTNICSVGDGAPDLDCGTGFSCEAAPDDGGASVIPLGDCSTSDPDSCDANAMCLNVSGSDSCFQTCTSTEDTSCGDDQRCEQLQPGFLCVVVPPEVKSCEAL